MDMPQDAPVSVFDFAGLTPRERYKLLIGTVVPRPIAWVTTVDARGVVNAAPYSFFNCLSHDPPIVALGVENWADMRMKDTTANIRATGEFTVNIVSDALAEAMNLTAVPFPPEIDEVAAAGLTTAPGVTVAAPRIAEAAVAIECRKYMVLSIGRAREIVLGEVTGMQIRSSIVDPHTFHVDAAGLDAIGRLGGHGYARTRDAFDLKTMSVEDVAAGRIARRAPKP